MYWIGFCLSMSSYDTSLLEAHNFYVKLKIKCSGLQVILGPRSIRGPRSLVYLYNKYGSALKFSKNFILKCSMSRFSTKKLYFSYPKNIFKDIISICMYVSQCCWHIFRPNCNQIFLFNFFLIDVS